MKCRVKIVRVRLNFSVFVADRLVKLGKAIGIAKIRTSEINPLLRCALDDFVNRAKTVCYFSCITVFAAVQTTSYRVPSAVAPFDFSLIHFNFPSLF